MSEINLKTRQGIPFEKLEVGKTYVDGLYSHFEIYEFYEKDGCFLGKMVDGNFEEYFESLERFNADGSIFGLLPYPPEHNLKWQVVA